MVLETQDQIEVFFLIIKDKNDTTKNLENMKCQDEFLFNHYENPVWYKNSNF